MFMKKSFLKTGKPTLPMFSYVISRFFQAAAPKNSCFCFVSEVTIQSNFFTKTRLIRETIIYQVMNIIKHN